MPRGTDLESLKARLPDDWKDVPIFSFSQLTTADRCTFKWHLKYQLKHKTPGNPRMDTGTFIHQLLFDLYMSMKNLGITAREWTEKRQAMVLAQIVDELKFPADQMHSVSTANRIVNRYCYTDVLEGHTPVGAEEHFYVLVTLNSGRRFILQGYVDLITIDAFGRVWVWDHKGGEQLWKPMRIRMEIQLPIYQILLRSDGMDVYGVCVNQLNSFPYKKLDEQTNDKLFQRSFDVRSPIQLKNIWSEFTTLGEEVLDLVEGRTKPRRSLQDHDCYKCDQAHLCLRGLNGELLDEALAEQDDFMYKYRAMPAGDGVTIIGFPKGLE